MLVGRAQKIVQETARGEIRCDLGVMVDRAADSGDPRTYKAYNRSSGKQLILVLVYCL